MRREHRYTERGQVIVLFALLFPVVMGLGAIVIGVGNWYTHARNLQTKADAAALAGGGVWDFPCVESVVSGGVTSTQKILDQAREYAGPHTEADGTVYTGTTLNPQVGNVGATRIHAVMNGPSFYDNDSNTNVADQTSPAGSVCQAETLDVKLTEDDTFPLFSLLPVFPDIKRKARVEIHQVKGLSGLLPISVRVPKPVSAAAVYYNEDPTNRTVIAASYFCNKAGMAIPAGLDGWTTVDPLNPSGLCSSPTTVSVAGTTGVVIATSFRPACSGGVTTNCFSLNYVGQSIDNLCRQGGGQYVQCFFATGTGSSQSVQKGLQFIRGYTPGNVQPNDPPQLRSAWLDVGSCASTSGSPYFASRTGSCSATFKAEIDVGSNLGPNPSPPPAQIETRSAANTEVRYRIVYRNPGNGNLATFCAFNTTNCDMNGSGGPGNTSWRTTNTLPLFAQQTDGNAIAIRVRLRKTTVNGTACGNNFSATCQWFFTGAGRSTATPTDQQVYDAPVQRSFMGDDDLSGPIKYLHLTRVSCGNGLPNAANPGEDASVPTGQNCFYVDMGLKGAIAQDQNEPPVVFNLKGSQSAILDCDPNIPNVKGEIVAGCSPFYAVNQFNTNPLCPGTAGFWTLPKPAPFDNYPPFRCVLTQTGNPRQILDGFEERLFASSSNPACPADNANAWVKGRNYWHDANNLSGGAYTFAHAGVHGNNLLDADPRLISLFMTGYDSFTGSGNQTFPIINFGSFYVTGWGTGSPGGGLTIEDPCSSGSSDPSGAGGNSPPPDIVTEPGGAYVWGHFINNVVPSPNASPSDEFCAPASNFMPCVAVLVQ